MTDQSLCLRLSRLQAIYRNRPIIEILDEVIDRRWRLNRVCQLREKERLSELDTIELSVLMRYFYDYFNNRLYEPPIDAEPDAPLAELEYSRIVAVYGDAPRPSGHDDGNMREVITSGCI